MLSIDTRLRVRGFRSEVVRSPVIAEAVRISRSIRERASRTLEELGSASRRIRESEDHKLEVLVRESSETIKDVRRRVSEQMMDFKRKAF
jgi:hypothetical protein